MNIEERRNYVMEMNEEEFEAFEYIVSDVVDNYGYYVNDGVYIVTMDEDMFDRAHDTMKNFIAEINTRYDLLDDYNISEEDWLAYNTMKDMLNDIYYDLR